MFCFELAYGDNGLKSDFGGHDEVYYDNVLAYVGNCWYVCLCVAIGVGRVGVGWVGGAEWWWSGWVGRGGWGGGGGGGVLQSAAS
jgi:hypothetical protein